MSAADPERRGRPPIFKCFNFSRHENPAYCPFCGVRNVSKLCDAVMPWDGKSWTCDSAMCVGCALRVGQNSDVCPDHQTADGKQAKVTRQDAEEQAPAVVAALDVTTSMTSVLDALLAVLKLVRRG